MRSLRYIIPFLVLQLLFSCGGNSWQSEPVSADSVELGKMINLHNFRPDSVRFQYHYFDNSGFVPGPSDYRLDALLYFSDSTFARLRNASLQLPPFTMSVEDNFAFEWLDKNTLTELAARDSNSKEIVPDNFAGIPLSHGGYVLLKNKVLLNLRSW